MNSTEKHPRKPGDPCEHDEILEENGAERRVVSPEDELKAAVDRLQRLQAEFENYKKRAAREALIQEERVTDRVLLDFLPLYDNLQRAFRSLASNRDKASFIEGIEQIFAQFRLVLEARGVQPICCLHEPFNPEEHEAMLCVSSEAVKKNHIIEEFAPGYRRDERVLRPSKVSVSQGPALHEEDIG